MNVQSPLDDGTVTAQLTRPGAAPLLTLVPPGQLVLTPEKLIETRWRVGVSGRGELTSSFYFGADGRVKVFKSFNEAAWQLKDGKLELCDVQGVVAWRFDLAFQVAAEDGGASQLLLVSGFRKPTTNAGVTLYLLEHRAEKAVAAPAPVVEEGPAKASAGPEAVRLVIWDLDDTFWQGTLSEGAVVHNPRNVAIVEALNQRGIVSAICSKNNPEPVEAALREAGLWEKFVFPKIAFAPKGAMVAEIIKDSQLRAATVMFVDDNVTNLNEALYYSPGLQIAEPEFLERLLDDPRFAGKPDPELSRLQRYKVLERKIADQSKSASGGDNVQFLRDSDVRVSIHANAEEYFTRIHDLVNRTNQLNFTKNRWPEDVAAAHRQFEQELGASFVSECGVVKVADRYGSYGVCGFYLVSNGTCTHFLFSCRSMNMGVEQFIWAKLGRPFVPIQGEVISDIDSPVDWIRVVDDADVADAGAPARDATTFSIGMFGACNLAMAATYLRQWYQVGEEFNYPYHDWGIFPLPRIIASAAEAKSEANQQVLARLPGMPPTRYESFLIDGSVDAYVLSFSSESFCGYYRVRSTGLVVPLINGRIGKRDFGQVSFEELERNGVAGMSREQWRFMQEELEFVGAFDPARFAADVKRTLEITKAHGKPVILIGLNETVGRDQPILGLFGEVNRIVNPMAAAFGIPVIDVAQFIRGEEDIADDMGGAHYRRQIYAKIAAEVRRLLEEMHAAKAA